MLRRAIAMHNEVTREAIKAVANAHSLPEELITSRGRKNQVINARFQAVNLVKQSTKMCLLDIGKLFSYNDHSTVWHALKKHKSYMAYDRDYCNKYNAALKEFRAKTGKSTCDLDYEIETIKEVMFSPKVINSPEFRIYKKKLNDLLEQLSKQEALNKKFN
jgi:hypothetical protein